MGKEVEEIINSVQPQEIGPFSNTVKWDIPPNDTALKKMANAPAVWWR